jgi:hypothetical protein
MHSTELKFGGLLGKRDRYCRSLSIAFDTDLSQALDVFTQTLSG